MSSSEKKKKETQRRFSYIITNYREARQRVDQSKQQLNDTSRELDEIDRIRKSSLTGELKKKITFEIRSIDRGWLG